MVVNFRARGISRGARKLARTPTIIKKKNHVWSILRGITRRLDYGFAFQISSVRVPQTLESLKAYLVVKYFKAAKN